MDRVKSTRRMTPDGKLSYWPVFFFGRCRLCRTKPDIDCLDRGLCFHFTPLTFCITDSSGFREKEFQISFGGR